MFPLAIPDCLRIAAYYLDCKADFLSQTDLCAKSHDWMSALSTAASRVPKGSVASPLGSKGIIQWQITSAVVACLIFDVKAERWLTRRECGLTEDNRCGVNPFVETVPGSSVDVL